MTDVLPNHLSANKSNPSMGIPPISGSEKRESGKPPYGIDLEILSASFSRKLDFVNARLGVRLTNEMSAAKKEA